MSLWFRIWIASSNLVRVYHCISYDLTSLKPYAAVSITETRWKPPYFSIPGTTITDLPSARNVTGSYTLEEETKLVLDYIGGGYVKHMSELLDTPNLRCM